MSNVKVGKISDIPQTIVDSKTYFDGSFGITHDEHHQIENIRIKVYGSQVAYLKSKPFHSSQKEIAVGDGWTIFEYKITPSYNFYQQVLAMREKAEIIGPQAVRKEIGTIISQIANLYK